MEPDAAPPEDTPSTPAQNGPPTLSQSEAAKRCGVSATTIRRARNSGRLEGVTPDGNGGWRIPIPSLITAGLLDRVSPPSTSSISDRAPDAAPLDSTPVPLESLRTDLAEAQHRAALAEQRANGAEALAADRARALEDLRQVLRMLEAPPAEQPNIQPTQPAGPEPEDPRHYQGPGPSQHHGFFARLFNRK